MVSTGSPLSPQDIARIFMLESGGNPSARTGSYRGLGQFGPKEEKQYGINDSNFQDPITQAAAVAKEANANRATLANALGREPTGADYYLAHQQGAAGASALFSNPTTPAWQAVRPFYGSDEAAQRAITGNIPRGSALYGKDVNGITSADFSGLWANKFAGGGAPAAGATPTAATPDPTAAVAALQPAAAGKTAAPAATSNPLQSAGSNLMAQSQQGPQPFQFMNPGLPPILPTGPVRPLPLAPRGLLG